MIFRPSNLKLFINQFNIHFCQQGKNTNVHTSMPNMSWCIIKGLEFTRVVYNANLVKDLFSFKFV